MYVVQSTIQHYSKVIIKELTLKTRLKWYN